MNDPKKLQCDACTNECNIENLSKEAISFCPFCGEETFILEEVPLLTTFDDYDKENN